MKNLKLLNKKYLSIFFCFLFLQSFESFSNEPVDIWNLENQDDPNVSSSNNDTEKNITSTNAIYEMQIEKEKKLNIEEDETLISKKIEIVGLYDPSENGLTIDMWKNSDGNRVLDLYNKTKKIDLSEDSKEILKIALLTNSYFPSKNITNEDFLKLKQGWLLENSDLNLIEEYLIKNKKNSGSSELVKFLINEYLSNSEIEKSCEIFSKINYLITDDYLSKFNIYCLINNSKKEEAQLLFDLKKEQGFEDIFFEKKFNYLMDYDLSIDETISEENILNFHLSHRTNPNFKFEPSDSTKKSIWKYLSTSNLLANVESIDLEDKKKIDSIEKATHEGNYKEKELFNLYKRFQFNINQLLSVEQSYKLLSNSESRALLYQGILITSDIGRKLELVKILKDSFENDEKGKAFNNELASILTKINEDEVPSNHTDFYNRFVKSEKSVLKKIKINNKIIHQSKLINYFKGEVDKENAQKDLNDILKKTKKNKKYFISTKDIILLESMKSDGFKFMKKYDSLYTVDDANIPSDIEDLIENNESGLVLLRLVQILGQDNFKDLGSETLFFIVSALNQLDIDQLRNKILLKILPLKV